MTLQRAPILLACLAGLAAAACAGGEPPPQKQPQAAARGCAPIAFPIYFQTGSDALTEPALQSIRVSARQASGCNIASVRVVGLADSDGGAAANLELSKRRADKVAQALAAEGFPEPAFDVDFRGDAGARTPSGAADPVRRRTEVLIEFRG